MTPMERRDSELDHAHDFSCQSCERVFSFLSDFSRSRYQSQNRQSPSRSSLLYHAFDFDHNDNHHSQGISVALENALYVPAKESHLSLTPTPVSSYYLRRQPNCISVAVTSGLRGIVVGSVFGGAMGMSFLSFLLFPHFECYATL